MTDDPAASSPPAPDRAADRAPGSAPARAPDLALARMHLRLGSLQLARAELETLANRDQLDHDGVVDLAEVRWRTGDITGAGEAAALVIDDEEGPVLALVVAAEAAAARGRPTEARRLAEKAMAVANGSIDAIFAGMPRSPAWPPDPAAPPPAPTTMFEPPRMDRPKRAGRPRPAAEPVADAAAPAEVASTEPSMGLWDEAAASAAEAQAASEAEVEVEVAMPSGEDALDRGRAALEAGDVASASVQLALVLRLTPALAPAVLDLVGEDHRPGMAVVRGDAYRLVGRELDARRAYADAARPDAARPDQPPAEGDRP
jgi:hypothetical protein